MQLLEERNIEHKDNTFVLKLFGAESGFSVVALLNGQQVSPSYKASFETHIDYFMQHKQSIIENLFGLAQSDIEHELYFRN